MPEYWELTTVIAIGKHKNGDLWIEGSGRTACPLEHCNEKCPVQDGDVVPVSNQFVLLGDSQKYAILPPKGVRIVITYVLLKQSHIATYLQTSLPRTNSQCLRLPTQCEHALTKKDPEIDKRKDVVDKVLDEAATKDQHPARVWEQHKRDGHLPKFPDCPVCLEEQGSVVRHAHSHNPSLRTMHIDTGYWDEVRQDVKNISLLLE